MRLLYPFGSSITHDLISSFLVKEEGALHLQTRIYISKHSKGIALVGFPPHSVPRHRKGNEKNLEDMKPSILLGKPNTFSFQWTISCHMVGLQVDFLILRNDMLKKHMHLCRFWYGWKLESKACNFHMCVETHLESLFPSIGSPSSSIFVSIFQSWPFQNLSCGHNKNWTPKTNKTPKSSF